MADFFTNAIKYRRKQKTHEHRNKSVLKNNDDVYFKRLQQSTKINEKINNPNLI